MLIIMLMTDGTLICIMVWAGAGIASILGTTHGITAGDILITDFIITGTLDGIHIGIHLGTLLGIHLGTHHGIMDTEAGMVVDIIGAITMASITDIILH